MLASSFHTCTQSTKKAGEGFAGISDVATYEDPIGPACRISNNLREWQPLPFAVLPSGLVSAFVRCVRVGAFRTRALFDWIVPPEYPSPQRKLGSPAALLAAVPKADPTAVRGKLPKLDLATVPMGALQEVEPGHWVAA